MHEFWYVFFCGWARIQELQNLEKVWLTRLDEYGCVEPSCLNVNVSEIVIGYENAMSVYPNPTSGNCTLEWNREITKLSKRTFPKWKSYSLIPWAEKFNAFQYMDFAITNKSRWICIVCHQESIKLTGSAEPLGSIAWRWWRSDAWQIAQPRAFVLRFVFAEPIAHPIKCYLNLQVICVFVALAFEALT